MFLYLSTNLPAKDASPWQMIAQVQWRNHYGPDCSYKGYPHVVFSDGTSGTSEGNLPTIQTRSDALPEKWVDLPINPDGSRDTKGALGHLLILTTQRDPEGRPCPKERIVPGYQVKFTLPGVDGVFYLSGSGGTPIYEGPTLTSCDGRIAVTPFARLQ